MLAHILNSINDFFWDIPFLTFVVGIGLYNGPVNSDQY